MNSIWVVLKEEFDEETESFAIVIQAADRPQILEQWVEDYITEHGLDMRKSNLSMTWYGKNITFYVSRVPWLNAKE